MTADQFPSLRAHAKDPAYFDSAVETIAQAVRAGSIRNTDLQDAKHALSSSVSRAWDEEVSVPHFDGKSDLHSTAVQELYFSINLHCLHDILAAHRKLEKTTLTGALVDAMHAFTAEIIPLAQAVASLKDKVVKGRAPSAAPSKPANPDKIVKTCPCCFRTIAVVNGVMAHHGYERYPGRQTSSCYGIRFPPLEVSTEGLEWLIGHVTESLTGSRAAHTNRSSRDCITRLQHHKLTMFTKDSPEWPQEFKRYVEDLVREIDSMTRHLQGLQETLVQWQTKPPAVHQ